MCLPARLVEVGKAGVSILKKRGRSSGGIGGAFGTVGEHDL